MKSNVANGSHQYSYRILSEPHSQPQHQSSSNTSFNILRLLDSVSLRTRIWGRGKRINLSYSFSNFCCLSCSKAAALFVSSWCFRLIVGGFDVRPNFIFRGALESSLHIDGDGVCNWSCFGVMTTSLFLCRGALELSSHNMLVFATFVMQLIVIWRCWHM